MIAEMLIESRKVLLKDGWIQGQFHKDGGHCVIGAAYAARDRNLSLDFNPNEADKFLCDFIRDYANFDDVANWNDEPERTYEEVLWMLDEAIDDAKERGL